MKTTSKISAGILIVLCLGLGDSAQAHGHGGGHGGGGHFGGPNVGGGHYGYFGPGFYPYPGYGYGYGGYYGCTRYYRGRFAGYPAADSLAAEVQIELAQRGYYRGPIDGIIGRGSRSALRAFQHRAGLPVTGRIDRATLHLLGIG